jgi:hypothetical protein
MVWTSFAIPKPGWRTYEKEVKQMRVCNLAGKILGEGNCVEAGGTTPKSAKKISVTGKKHHGFLLAEVYNFTVDISLLLRFALARENKNPRTSSKRNEECVIANLQ